MDRDDKTVGQVLARNLQALMEHNTELRSAAAVSRATDRAVSDNTILNMLHPERGIAATVDNLQAVATVFEREAWELLHPDLDASDRERALIASWRALDDQAPKENSRSPLKPTANPPRAPSVHQPRAPYTIRKQTSRKS